MLFLLAHYLSIPSQNFLHENLQRMSNKVEKLMRGKGEESMSINMMLDKIKSKECSFYWDKIIYCAMQISNCGHPKDIPRSHFTNTEAEYVGLITSDTLKKLGDGYWLDSTITDSVISYIRNIEGANDDHHDGKREVFIFNHT